MCGSDACSFVSPLLTTVSHGVDTVGLDKVFHILCRILLILLSKSPLSFCARKTLGKSGCWTVVDYG